MMMTTEKKLGLKNVLHEICRELLDLSTQQNNLNSKKRGGQDLGYTLQDPNLVTRNSPCSVDETM